MQYRLDPKSGNQLSCLGLGCMRLPKDDKLAAEIVRQAVEKGINYLDTAYIYGDNEERLGKILTQYNLRDKVFLATKLPLLKLRKAEDIENYFATELKRLQTDHIDYYLMHMLPDVAFWEQLKKWGIIEWLAEKQQSGAIRQVGFSFHGTKDHFLELLEVYPWQFCLIQYNYIDEFSQAGVDGLKRAHELGLPVMIMEPLLGGKLVNGLPKAALELLAQKYGAANPAAFGLNWLWNQPEVTLVLSGMNTLEQLDENLALAARARTACLTAADLAVYDEVRQIFSSLDKIKCTACNYCMPCPRGVNIPSCFKSYNLSYSEGWYSGMHNYAKEAGITSTKLATASCCTGCGKCERHCPQHIAIRKQLKLVAGRLEPWPLRVAIKVARKIMKRG